MAHRNVGKSIPYLKIEQEGCHLDQRMAFFRKVENCRLGERTRPAFYDQDLYKNRVSAIGHSYTETEGRCSKRA